MVPNQRVVGTDGYEVLLFPLEYMYMSQGEGGGTSHQGTYQIDFLGWGPNGRVYHCPYYAPCTCRCVGSTDSFSNNRIYQSTDRVHLANGTMNYVTFEVAHDNTPPHAVGDTVQQGQLLGYTGTAGNVTGDHLHFQTAYGTYAGWIQLPNGNWMLRNEMHIYDACYVNDTVIVNGYGYNWREWDGPTPPPVSETPKKKFPWVLYARKFRDRANV